MNNYFILSICENIFKYINMNYKYITILYIYILYIYFVVMYSYIHLFGVVKPFK